MEEADIFSEIDITEQDISFESTKMHNGTENSENALSQTEKFENQNRQKHQSSFGHDLSCITKTPNEDVEITKNVEDVSSLNIEKCEDREMVSEQNSMQEMTLESKASNETMKIMPEFQFVEHDLSNESNRSNKTENSEQKSGQDILHEDLNVTQGNFNELKQTEGQNKKIEAPTLKTLKPESSSEKLTEKINKKFTILHEDEFSDGEKDTADISMVALLRSTISELERALRDSRMLIKTRDEDIASLRKEVEKGREQIHKEQLKWQRKCAVVEERGRKIQELEKKLLDSEKTVEELSERIKEFESPCSESDDIVACCSSMKELLELKMELVEKDEIIKEIQKNNPDGVLENAIVSAQSWKAKEERVNAESDQHNQLKLKFLRDAFFYFMIDFHSEEQIKAILAVLSYGDQREDVIHQAYRMRQRGKKFAVKEVSSRGLAFLHEES